MTTRHRQEARERCLTPGSPIGVGWQLAYILLVISSGLIVRGNQSLSLHPFGNDAIDFLWLLPKQPMRSVDISGSVVCDVCTHLVGELVRDDSVAQGSHEKSGTFDLRAVLDRKQRLVGLEVGLAVAVVVACCLSVPCRSGGLRGSKGHLQGGPCFEYSST